MSGESQAVSAASVGGGQGGSFGKRLFDVVVSAVCLVVLTPLLLVLALAIKLDSPGPVFYRGWRAGMGNREFRLIRFRTMVRGAHKQGPPITQLGDPRVTRFGRWLRSHKLDRLPELINVLRGELSLVGPLPEDPSFVALYTAEQLQVLEVQPGMTGPAALAFTDEEWILALSPSTGGSEYLRSILPVKLELDLAYVTHHGFRSDLSIMLASALRLIPGPRPSRGRWLLIDVATAAIAFLAAAVLRWLDLGSNVDWSAVLLWAGPIALVFAIANRIVHLDRSEWSRPSMHDLGGLVLSVSGAATVTLAADLAAPGLGVAAPHRGEIVIGAVICLAGFMMVRYVSGPLTMAVGKLAGGHLHPQRTIIFGAGETGRLAAWRLLTEESHRPYKLLGFIDDDPAKKGLRLHGASVLGDRTQMVDIVERLQVELIVIAISERTPLREVVAIAQQTPARLQMASAIFSTDAPPRPLIRDITVADLHGRAPSHVTEPAQEWLSIKSALVTGAAGSIGSELCRQLAGIGVPELFLVDNNESGLYDLEIELKAQNPDQRIDVCVGDVTDAAKMRRIMAEASPQLVFHAAAYKHVPLMERFPEEAVRVNLGGTSVVLEQSLRHGVERFVLVSTDKAVDPSCTMGMTKRIAERLVLARASDGRGRMLRTAVRFGNVLGSRGSVVPTFARQIELGGPVTVTHPEMTRYFMDISEAANLILQAAYMTRGGEIFMLDMGEAIPIPEIASRMIRMRGLRPDVDVKIEYTGIRPGEKLHEVLLHTHERSCPTEHPLIHAIEGTRPIDEAEVISAIDELSALAAREDRPSIRSRLAAFARELSAQPTMVATENAI